MFEQLHVIIPAGGAGTRLWPLSRRSRPKFLLDLDGSGRSLLQATVERLEPVAASISIVTGGTHRDGVLEQLPDFSTHAQGERTVVIEPSGRDSMAAIGLAAYVIRGRFGDDAIIGSFAADHLIARPELLLQAVDAAASAAAEGFVTTIGITPTGPSMAYGYIQPSLPLTASPGAERVLTFVEKPDAQTAARYVDEGFVWNAGIFIMKAGTLVSHLARLMPDMHKRLSDIAHAWGSDDYEDVLAENWPHLTKIAIDHAIAEPVAADGRVAVVRAHPDLGWTDLGDFAALASLSSQMGDATRIDAHRAYVFNRTSQSVAVVGVSDVAIALTQDAVLVTRLDRAQDVKKVVDDLNDSGQQLLL
ncbi:mannose-1-phosphate guanylyltransferase [Schaalia vaccimaxillae]|uniref:mannose-1-phosphate guanylyltransferase n=1 Tax=Schaalia vaccimaxillae TaxID=183916 RepID=UPI0003B591D8|nr:mannose-1-phosphate guanylyltransferase [Schaalia vaccimaxillae]